MEFLSVGVQTGSVDVAMTFPTFCVLHEACLLDRLCVFLGLFERRRIVLDMVERRRKLWREVERKSPWRVA